MNSFACCHCAKTIVTSETMGTKHRNHCNFCLWSKHVDDKIPGDRASNCGGCMKPIALTYKNEDKKYKEVMIVHQCPHCRIVGSNRIAADDDTDAILAVLDESAHLDEKTLAALKEKNIEILSEKDKDDIKIVLFGKVT